MRKLNVLFAMLVLGSGAHAGTATGAIHEIHVANHVHTVAFSLNTPIKDTPRCNESNRFTFDLRKQGGDAMLQTLLVAKRDDFTVRVQGLNTCSLEWKAENVRDISIK